MHHTDVQFAIGKEKVTASIPNLMAVVAPKPVPAVPDARAEIRRALANPIGSPTLSALAKGKRSAAIVVNDITRPYPGGLMVEELTRELALAGLRDEDICLVVAYGTHRVNTQEELIGMFGEEVVRRFRFVHHRGQDESTLVSLGFTKGGVEVTLNKEFARADLKIVTGLIVPHQSAGFSGGRKSVLPGICGLPTLKLHHSFPIRPNRPAMGWMDGNAFHEESLEAAKIARVDFMINSVENMERGIVAVVAGDIDAAHRKGVDLCRSIWSVDLAEKADAVIVSPGGYPRDIDLYQSQKAIACGELSCKPGGRIILCAATQEGAGKFAKLLADASDPQEVIDKYTNEGYTAESTAKAYMTARALKNFKVGVACSTLTKAEAKAIFMDAYASIDEAIATVLAEAGPDATFLAIPNAAEMIITRRGEL